MGPTSKPTPKNPRAASVASRWNTLLLATIIPLLTAAAWLLQPTAVSLWPQGPWFAIALGLGVAGTACQCFMLWYVLRRFRPLTKIHGAVDSWGNGEQALQLLEIADDGSELSHFWNRLIHAWTQAHQAVCSQHADTQAQALTKPAADRTAIFDLLPYGLLVIDAAGKVQSANGAACRVLMRSRERLIDAPLNRLIEDEPLARIIATCTRNPKSRGGSVEVTLPQDDGHEAIIRSAVRPLGAADNPQVLIVLEDVTHQRVADKSRNLFVAQAAHELRTPLTNIGLYLERAIDLTDTQVAERSECLNVINSEVGRLGRVIEEFLSVSEIESGSLQVRRDDVRIDELLERLESEYQPQADAKPLALTFDLPPKLSVVQGDREKISLAIHNLIGNAIKYTPAGKQVRVEVAEDAANIEVRVSDTGIGIRDSDLTRVFDKFYRAKDDRIESISGTGLGLALAREVIRLHGGDITVESTLNAGSTFTLRVPLRHPADTAESTPASQPKRAA